MNYQKTYNIYGIGEILDDDISETYKGQKDYLKKEIEDSLRNIEKIASSKGLDQMDITRINEKTRRKISIAVRKTSSGYKTELTVTEPNGMLSTFNADDIQDLADNMWRIERRASGYENLLPQRRYRPERDFNEDLILRQPDKQKGKDNEQRRAKQHDEERKDNGKERLDR